MTRDHRIISDEIDRLRHRLIELEAELATVSPRNRDNSKLNLREYQRYGRQMILNEIGLPGQLKLKKSSILVIGAGGLGCPVLLYLVASGIGEITILDHDQVELSNLHRQVLHTESRIGMNKSESARIGLTSLNTDVEINAYPLAFTPSLFHPSSMTSTPASILDASFSLIIDCTDNPDTRYFLNAYASAHRIPLVSGGAVRTEGVVGVYGLPLPMDSKIDAASIHYGPCYACVFPPAPIPAIPPSEEQKALQGTGACSDEGVIGVACGIVGLTMASEALRVLLGTAKPTLLLFSPLSSTPFRTIKVRPRKPTCISCSASASSSWLSSIEELQSTGEWPGWVDPLCEIVGAGDSSTNEDRMGIMQFKEARNSSNHSLVVIDLRSEAQFGICSLEGSKNIPFPTFLRDPSIALASVPESRSIHLLCRKGNDSYLAAKALRRCLASSTATTTHRVFDIVGGLQAWSAEVDHEFPVY